MDDDDKNNIIPFPNVEIVDDVPVVSSVEVAERFDKQHKHVLDKIGNVFRDCPNDFNRPNFRPVKYIDKKGESRPAYNMTRDGFLFLASRFTGKKAARWMIRFIAAFNAMEKQLVDSIAGGSGLTPEQAEALRLIPAIYACLRREISIKTKKKHDFVLRSKYGWRCPLCGEKIEGKPEYDHFNNPAWNAFHQTWPICSDCHKKITHKIARGAEVQDAFSHYQRMARLSQSETQKQISIFDAEVIEIF